MKKLFLTICALCTMHYALCATSVWSGTYNFPAAGDGWQEVAAEDFAELELGDSIRVTVSEITNPDGWAQINLAAKNPWLTIPGTNWGDVYVGTNSYVVADSALLVAIQTSGLGVQGKYFTLTDISIVEPDTVGPGPGPGPGPDPEGQTTIWSGEFSFNAEGSSSFPDLKDSLFASLAVGDYIQLTVSEVTNPDGWWQINMAAKDPWTSLPGTGWETYTETGDFRFELNDADLVANIIRSGLAVQGKHMTITAIAIIASHTTDVETTGVSTEATKKLINGQVIILRAGKRYTIFGHEL